MKTEIRNEGLEIHDAGMRITAKSHSSYPGREVDGKEFPPLEVNHLLADIRLPANGFADLEAFKMALEIAESLEAGFKDYPDGEVAIEISYIEAAVNW